MKPARTGGFDNPPTADVAAEADRVASDSNHGNASATLQPLRNLRRPIGYLDDGGLFIILFPGKFP
jgi:hypothetical protein